MRTIVAFLALAAAAGSAAAQTLYKLVDRNGKVTYTQEEPKGFEGTVTRIDIDPSANTATLPRFTPPAKAAPSAGKGAEGKAERRATPQERLERAKRELADAIANPGPEDLTRVGNVGGGTRPVPTEAYTRRLAALEQAVKDAEEEVRRSSR